MISLDKYFSECIKRVYTKFNLQNSEEVDWFYIVVDKQILFDARNCYANDIRDYIIKTLTHNLRSTYGLTTKGPCVITTGIRADYKVNKIRIDNEVKFISYRPYFKLSKDEMMSLTTERKLALVNAYKDVFNKKATPMTLLGLSYEDYKVVYEKAFGESVDINITDYSLNVTICK